jgi:(p)ppGpp synthase/HD superfamily hydrolase
MISASILKAADQAARWHEEQRRKGSKGEPYVNHLIEVAALVAEADPGNAELIIAALLHDAIEDQPISRKEIAKKFGERVAGLVMEATDDKSLPKHVRKQLQIETAPKKSRDAKLLKLADKISNLRSIAASPPAHWNLERRRAYIEWSSAVAVGLVGVSDWLDARFEEARELAYQSVMEAEKEVAG